MLPLLPAQLRQDSASPWTPSDRDDITARRNVLLGLWAARRIGLSGADAELYAWGVHFSDLGEPGHEDVIGKVERDFAAAGRPLERRAIRRELHAMQLRAEVALLQDEREPTR